MEIKLKIAGKDITRYVESITWSGDIQQYYRTLSVKLADGIRPGCGDKVLFYYGGKLQFSGYIQEVSQDAYSCSIEAHDIGMYLARNYMFREYKGTPQAITRKVCSEVGLKVGKLAAKKAVEKITSTGSKAAGKVIEEAYEGTKKRAKQYAIYIKGGRLYIEKVGTYYVAAIAAEIETATRTWSIKNMVDRVIILDDKDKKSGSVENKSDRKKYGTFQKIYKKQKGKNAKAEAKELLTRLERKGSITAVGNIVCTAGKKIKITEKSTGLSGRQIIKADKHNFTASGHEMTLELYYYEAK